MKTRMLKTGNEMVTNFSALESFSLSSEQMIKLFGGTGTGSEENDVRPLPIVKEEEGDGN